MDKDLLDKILSSVNGSENVTQAAPATCNLTEFVGAGIGETV